MRRETRTDRRTRTRTCKKRKRKIKRKRERGRGKGRQGGDGWKERKVKKEGEKLVRWEIKVSSYLVNHK